MTMMKYQQEAKSLCCVSAGLFFVIPCTDQFVRVDLRTVSFGVPPQEVSTATKTRVSVATASTYFQL